MGFGYPSERVEPVHGQPVSTVEYLDIWGTKVQFSAYNLKEQMVKAGLL